MDSVVSTTNANNRGAVLRKDMTGFNWSKVPVILIEVGFMSNQEECILLESEEYQSKIAEGISMGIVSYLTRFNTQYGINQKSRFSAAFLIGVTVRKDNRFHRQLIRQSIMLD